MCDVVMNCVSMLLLCDNVSDGYLKIGRDQLIRRTGIARRNEKVFSLRWLEKHIIYSHNSNSKNSFD